MIPLSFPLRSTFLGLPLEEAAKERYRKLQEALRDFADILRFQDPDQPHLTLQFWKEVMEIEYHQIIEQAGKIAAKAATFTVRTTEPHTFGHRGQDHVLFIDIAFSEELARLKKACPWPEGRPFHPHLTIARIRHPQKFAVRKKDILKLLKDAVFDIPVDRLRLYAEVDGKQQTPLRDFIFGGVGKG